MLGHTRHEHLMDRLFSKEGLTASEWQDLFKHLREDGCDLCNERYRRKRDQAGGPLPEEGPADNVARAMGNVLEEQARALLAASARPAAAPAPDPARPVPDFWKRLRAPWLVYGGATVAVCAALLLVPRMLMTEKPGDVPRPPGQPVLKGVWRPSADFYCLDGARKELLVLPGAVCPVGARLVAETRMHARRPFATLVMCEAGLTCRIVGVQDGTEGQLIKLASPPLPAAGQPSVFVAWTTRPVTSEQVVAAMNVLRSQGKCVHDVEQLPLTPGGPHEQLSFWVRAQPKATP